MLCRFGEIPSVLPALAWLLLICLAKHFVLLCIWLPIPVLNVTFPFGLCPRKTSMARIISPQSTVATFADSFLRCRLIECYRDSGDREEEGREGGSSGLWADLVEPPKLPSPLVCLSVCKCISLVAKVSDTFLITLCHVMGVSALCIIAKVFSSFRKCQ